MRRSCLVCLVLIGWSTLGAAASPDGSLSPLLDTLRKVEREGQGNREATRAWRELVDRAKAEQLPVLLAALDGAGPLGANWLRAAVDAVAERQLQGGGKLPEKELEAFLDQKQHDSRARRLAYEWIVRADSGARERLVPRFLDDPSAELRRDAVAQVLTAADDLQKQQRTEGALAAYRQALTAARDLDQVKAASESLKKLGQPVDLARHFGFILDWRLLGPFDNHGGKGFDRAYSPEASLDMTASYTGSTGEIRWVAHHTDDENGQVDLNKAIGKHMGAVAYVVAEFQSDEKRAVELRLGSVNANKIWLNGELLSWAEVYHSNSVMDQYVGRGTLEAGRNVILLKLCQNERTEDWAQDWKFQLRVCDSSGKAILSTDRPPAQVARQQTAKDAKE